jgi:hypothetical protein
MTIVTKQQTAVLAAPPFLRGRPAARLGELAGWCGDRHAR